MVLDLKDAFFCISEHPDSPLLFAFEWTDPDTCETSQLIWTVLHQKFTDSPDLFGNALKREWRGEQGDLQLINGTPLQYVGDILTASPTKEDSDENTTLTLNFSGQWG